MSTSENSAKRGEVTIYDDSTPFTGENFAAWKSTMETALYAKGKGGFIDGSLEVPDLKSPDFQWWKKNDAMVRAWLRNSLAKDIQESVVYTGTSREIWTEICERYG